MPQTNDALSSKDADIEFFINVDGTPPAEIDWTDLCGFSTSVEPSEQTRMTGTINTMCGDKQIVTSGKREAFDVTFNFVYTEADVDAFGVVRAAHEAGSTVWVRWFPKGKTDQNKVFRVENVPISGFTDPVVDANTADPLLAAFKVLTPEVVFETWTAP